MPCRASAGASWPVETVDHGRERNVHGVLLTVQEREPARLALLDHLDFHAVDHRQLAALQPREDLLAAEIRGGGLCIVELIPKRRVAFEHDT